EERGSRFEQRRGESIWIFRECAAGRTHSSRYDCDEWGTRISGWFASFVGRLEEDTEEPGEGGRFYGCGVGCYAGAGGGPNGGWGDVAGAGAGVEDRANRDRRRAWRARLGHAGRGWDSGEGRCARRGAAAGEVAARSAGCGDYLYAVGRHVHSVGDADRDCEQGAGGFISVDSCELVERAERARGGDVLPELHFGPDRAGCRGEGERGERPVDPPVERPGEENRAEGQDCGKPRVRQRRGRFAVRGVAEGQCGAE